MNETETAPTAEAWAPSSEATAAEDLAPAAAIDSTSPAAPSHESPVAVSAPTVSLEEAIRNRLSSAEAPLRFNELKKGLPNPRTIKPAAAFEAEVKRILDEEIGAGRAFAHPSGPAGENRYWGRDEKLAIQAALLTAASEARTLPELKKAARATRADAAFSDAVVEAMIAEQPGRLFRHPSGKAGTERFYIRDEKQVIREAVLAAAVEPRKLNDLKKSARESTRADKSFAEPIVDELIAGEMLHKQSAASSALYGREKPVSPNNREKVTEAILAAAESPRKTSDLVKEAARATGADKAFVATVLEEIIQTKQLHPQNPSKSPPYGRRKMDPLDHDPGKKAFAATVKAGRKLMEAVPTLSLDETIQRLRTALEQPASVEAPAPA